MNGLDKIIDRRVVAVALDLPGLDVAIIFEGNLILMIFCDELDEASDSGNYDLFLPDRILTVAARGKVVEYVSSKPARIIDFKMAGDSLVKMPTELGGSSVYAWKPLEPKEIEFLSLIGGSCSGFEIEEGEYSAIRCFFTLTESVVVAALVIGCSWRLDSPDAVLCGIGMTRDENLQGLRHIKNLPIVAIETSPLKDLRIYLGDGFKLQVFCTHVSLEDSFDNYMIESPIVNIVVGARGIVRRLL